MATDSYRLALRDLTGTGPLPEGTDQILIPARALTELQRLLPGRGKERRQGQGRRCHRVGFSVSDLDATFTRPGVRLTTRLLDGKFPDYRQLIPPGYPNQLRVGKEALLDALRRVRLLVRDNTTPVRLSMRPGGVELTVVSQEVGHASEDVDAEYEGEELTVAFNPTYLIDGVEAVLGDEVVLETSTPPSRRRSGPRSTTTTGISSCPSASRSMPASRRAPYGHHHPVAHRLPLFHRGHRSNLIPTV